MKGLIAAALGGVSRGVGEVAQRQMELDAREELRRAEEEMQMRLAEQAEQRQIRAEERRIGNIGREAEAAASAEESIMERRFGEGSNYPELLSREIKAGETPSQRVSRETAEFSLETARGVQDLRETLATMPEDDPAVGALTRQLNILTGGSTREARDTWGDDVGTIIKAIDALRETADDYRLSSEDREAASQDALFFTNSLRELMGRRYAPASGQTEPPQDLRVGDVHDGLRFKGGDSEDPDNWEPI